MNVKSMKSTNVELAEAVDSIAQAARTHQGERNRFKGAWRMAGEFFPECEHEHDEHARDARGDAQGKRRIAKHTPCGARIMHEREAEQAAVGSRLSKLIGTFEVRLRKAIEHQPDKDNHCEKRSAFFLEFFDVTISVVTWTLL